MVVSKSNKLIVIGAIAMIMAMTTLALDSYDQDLLSLMRATQLTATVALFFGVLKKKPPHTDKFLIFWMAITSILFGYLCYYNLTFMSHDFFNSFYDLCAVLQTSLLLFILLASTTLLGYMIYQVYQEYVELIQNDSQPVENSAILDTEERFPAYGSTENIVVSIPN